MDKIYILEQPKCIEMSILVIGKDWKMGDLNHKLLDSLAEKTDLFLIFIGHPEINKEKMASLYRASGYVIAEKGQGIALKNLLRYEKEIFQDKHLSFLVVQPESDPGFLEKTRKWTESGMGKPIFNLKRVGWQELSEYYIQEVEKKRWWEFWKKKKEPDLSGKYSTHNSDSPVIFFKTGILNILIKLEDSYIETFKETDIRYFLASAMARLGIECHSDEV